MVNKKRLVQFLTKRGHYGIIPNELWENRQLCHQSKLIFAYLVSKGPEWQSSRNNIGKNLGIRPSTVSASLQELETNNFLVIIRDGPRAWSFDLNIPSEWATSNLNPNLASDPVTSDTDSDGALDPGPTLIHTKEEIRKTSISSKSKSIRKRVADPVGGAAISSHTVKGCDNIPDRISLSKKDSSKQIESLIVRWRKSFASDLSFLSGKQAETSIRLLIQTLKNQGFHQNEIPIDTILRKCFGVSSNAKMKQWKESIEEKISDEILAQYEGALFTPEAIGSLEANDEYPRVQELYQQYIKEGKTPADFNGLPLLEYARQRAHAESYPFINQDELRRRPAVKYDSEDE